MELTLAEQFIVILCGYITVMALTCLGIFLIVRHGKLPLRDFRYDVTMRLPGRTTPEIKTIVVPASKIEKLEKPILGIPSGLLIGGIIHVMMSIHLGGALMAIPYYLYAPAWLNTLFALMGIVAWIIIWLLLRPPRLGPQEYAIGERLGVTYDVYTNGIPGTLPFVDKIVERGTYEVQSTRLFVDEDNPDVVQEIDFLDASAPGDARVHHYVAKDMKDPDMGPLLWHYMYDEPRKRLRELVGHRLRPAIQKLNHRNANTEIDGKIDEVLSNHGMSLAICLAEMGQHLRLADPITIDDLDWPKEVQQIRSRALEGEANRMKEVEESKAVPEAIEEIHKAFKRMGEPITMEKASDLYFARETLEKLSGSDFTFISRDLQEAFTQLMAAGLMKRRSPKNPPKKK